MANRQREQLTAEQLQAEREDNAEQLVADLRLAEDADRTATFMVDPMLPAAVRDALAGANVRWRRDDEPAKAAGASRESTEADARRIYIGTTMPPTTAAALDILSAETLWCALAEIEPAGKPPPAASLANRVVEHEAAVSVLRDLWSRHGQRSLALELPGGQTIRFRVLGAAIEAVTKLVAHELHVLRREHDHRAAARTDIAAANASTRGARGARGPEAEPERRRRMLAALQPLRVSAAWERRRISELVVESSTWRAPPCRTYVEELIDRAREKSGTGTDREKAVLVLEERLRVTERRTS